MRQIGMIFVLALVVSGCKSQRVCPECPTPRQPAATVVAPKPYKAPAQPIQMDEPEDCPNGMCPIRK